MVDAVILDWDGTLWDVLTFIVETYAEVMGKLGKKAWTRDEFREKFTHDWREVLEEMGLEKHEDMLVRHWEKKIKDRPNTYPWVNDFVSELEKRYKIAVVSSAPRKPLMKELRRNDILKHMKIVLSADDVENTKPDPEPLLYAAARMSAEPGKCVYIGDMTEDIIAAKRAGMKVIAVTWGIHNKNRLKAEKPDFIAETPREALDFIKGLP